LHKDHKDKVEIGNSGAQAEVLADYQDTHAPKPKPSAYTHREDKES
jgi:hypothetical protein